MIPIKTLRKETTLRLAKYFYIVFKDNYLRIETRRQRKLHADSGVLSIYTHSDYEIKQNLNLNISHFCQLQWIC